MIFAINFFSVSATNYNYTVDCITDSNGNIVKRDDPISSSTVYKITQKVFKNIDENSNTTFCIGKLVTKEESITYIPTTTNYIGYYADIDGDGTVDGVIFADLAFSESGAWKNNSKSSWSYEAQTNLKQYYVSQESYTGSFGKKPVISPVSGTTGNDRFYVMALSDIDGEQNGTYYDWYNTNEEYITEDEYITFIKCTDDNFGSGRSETKAAITVWNNKTYPQDACPSHKDIWGQIQTQVNNGWFVPSKGEWAAFGSALSITESNYSSFGLSEKYWTSSLRSYMGAAAAYAYKGVIHCQVLYDIISQAYSVRLATTF